MNLKRIMLAGAACVMLALPLWFAAAQDQQSLGDVAKKARAEKKSAQQTKKVFDNDNIDNLRGTINVIGEEPAAPAEQAKEGAGTEKPKDAAAPKATVKDESYWRDRFADANKKLADDQHELDILQREYNLKQQQFYTDPNAQLKQEYSRQDLNDQKGKIDDMAAQVARDRQAISDLEDELRRAGGDPGWERSTPNPPPQQ